MSRITVLALITCIEPSPKYSHQIKKLSVGTTVVGFSDRKRMLEQLIILLLLGSWFPRKRGEGVDEVWSIALFGLVSCLGWFDGVGCGQATDWGNKEEEERGKVVRYLIKV